MAICHLNMQFLCKKTISFSASSSIIKGTVSRDFLLLVFFMNQFPPSSRVFHLDRLEFFRKFAEIFASQGAPPVSTTPVANLPPVTTTPAAKLPPVSTTPVPPVSTTPVANFRKKKFELGQKNFFLLFQFWTPNMTQY